MSLLINDEIPDSKSLIGSVNDSFNGPESAVVVFLVKHYF
jgi:hypothetical protein